MLEPVPDYAPPSVALFDLGLDNLTKSLRSLGGTVECLERRLLGWRVSVELRERIIEAVSRVDTSTYSYKAVFLPEQACDCNASALLQSMLSCLFHHIGRRRWDPSTRRSLCMKLCNLLLFIYRCPLDHTLSVTSRLALWSFLPSFQFSFLLHLPRWTSSGFDCCPTTCFDFSQNYPRPTTPKPIKTTASCRTD